jgi:DNA polymerase epsilon subunit 1
VSKANQWLDVLDERGTSMDDTELLELISERKTISKTVEEYEGRKSTSLTTAARLADFLGADMVRDKGLNCNLIISRLPAGAPVTERAIPVAIFSCEPTIKKYFLRKWLKDSALDCDDFRHLVDWEYYKDRLGKCGMNMLNLPLAVSHLIFLKPLSARDERTRHFFLPFFTV